MQANQILKRVKVLGLSCLKYRFEPEIKVSFKNSRTVEGPSGASNFSEHENMFSGYNMCLD